MPAAPVVRCRHCRRRLRNPEARRAGAGRDCAQRHGEWAGRPRSRHPDVRQDETLFDLLDHPEEDPDNEDPWTTPNEDACSVT